MPPKAADDCSKKLSLQLLQTTLMPVPYVLLERGRYAIPTEIPRATTSSFSFSLCIGYVVLCLNILR
jgi:hypothetical protein